MAMDTSGFVPKGNLNTDSDALAKKGKSQTVKRVLSFLREHNALIVLSLVLAAVSVIATLLVPICIGRAIDAIGDESGTVSYWLLRAALLAATVAVTQFCMNLINNSITYRTVQTIRNEAIVKIEHLPLRYIDSNPQGDIVSRIVADADQFSEGLLLGFTQAFTGIMTIIATLVIMFSMNALITVVVVLVTPLSIFIARFISKRTYSMFGKQSLQRGQMTALIDEMTGNEKVVKAFAKEKEVLERFDEINERLSASSLSAIFFSSLTNPATRFVNAVCYALVALCGAFFCIGYGKIIPGLEYVGTVGTLTVFLSYANQYTKPFNEISNVITELENALACAGRIFDLIETETEVPDGDDAVVMKDASGHVDIENMSFSYSKDKKLITDFNLSIDKGMKVAIVGPTGCGKTTLINLLMRFYDVDSGSIKLDGVDLRDMTRESLRENYGMVLQETWLFHGTIFENIAMQKKNATMEEVVDAAKRAHAHSFISRLPDGYNTYVGDDMGGLSEGQRQLLCIARVMLALPPVLILDEATSSIDTRTEIKIQSAFKTMTEGRSSFVIAHRLSTIKHSDIILVMRDGNIIEKGNHETLMAMKGFYNELYTSQFALNQNAERS